MKRSPADIVREYGPFAGVEQVAGVTYDVFGSYTPDGFVLLSCISPGKKGGTWTPQNNYGGANCNTNYFNGAPYISGANVFSSNSLPQ